MSALTQSEIKHYIDEHLGEVEERSGTKGPSNNIILWHWLTSWTEASYKAWTKNPYVDYV